MFICFTNTGHDNRPNKNTNHEMDGQKKQIANQRLTT